MTCTHRAPVAAADNPQARKLNPNLTRLVIQALHAGPLTPRRCDAVLHHAAGRTGEISWQQRLREAMDLGEQLHVHRVAVALSQAGWLDAFELLCDYHPTLVRS